jgi:hypothetical protein
MLLVRRTALARGSATSSVVAVQAPNLNPIPSKPAPTAYSPKPDPGIVASAGIWWTATVVRG